MSVVSSIRSAACSIEPLTCRFTADQWIQVANVAGTWLAGLATLAAVIVSLWLARDARRVRLQVQCDLFGDMRGRAIQTRYVAFRVTNRGERPVTIIGVGWRIGGGPWPWQWRNRRYSGQDVAGGKNSVPLRLDHGDKGDFAVELSRGPWLSFFMDYVRDDPLHTLRGYVETATGKMVLVRVGARVQEVRDIRAQQAAASTESEP